MARTVIRGEQIKDNSVTGADVDEGSLRYTVRDFNSSRRFAQATSHVLSIDTTFPSTVV